jgi:hypothetical protein
MAHQALVDAHVQVNARISVSEGHRIAESARARVLREHPDVLDVLVHIDPEDDLDPDLVSARLPSREALLEELGELLVNLPTPEHVVLHYLGGRVEVEVFLAHDVFADISALRSTEAILAERIKDHPAIRSISLNFRVAPE